MIQVGIIMGSNSDWPVMQQAAQFLKEFGVEYEARVVSAHRTPDLMFEYAETARERGIKAIIAGAGGAARRTESALRGHDARAAGVYCQRQRAGPKERQSAVRGKKRVPFARIRAGKCADIAC